MTNVVEMTGVVKRFGSVTALAGLDLTVSAGEVHGFLGPNGAGKSTTLRLLLGMLRSDGGSTRVLEMDPWRNEATLHRRLAYVPGDVALWPNLTGGEVIDLLGRLQGGQDQARRDVLLKMFDLDPTKKARTYSKGNRQKVALIAALATDAEVFLLGSSYASSDPTPYPDHPDKCSPAAETAARLAACPPHWPPPTRPPSLPAAGISRSTATPSCPGSLPRSGPSGCRD